jgi:lipopolysaccharide/colanic/teichoic acid biosynthesis glycosyltransferase
MPALRALNTVEPGITNSRTFDRHTRAAVTTDSSLYLMTKRCLDVMASATLLALLSPVMLIVAICIKLESKGTVFFFQERCGLHGKSFKFFKFRSMVVDAEARKATIADQSDIKSIRFKMARDPRVTRIGAFIRKYSIDELPQLLNVLLGDMSLVGPRPPLPSEVAEYTQYQYRRLAVIPGITCTWQVGGRSDIAFEEQADMDIMYIRTRSLWQDLWILIQTPLAVITAKGAY